MRQGRKEHRCNERHDEFARQHREHDREPVDTHQLDRDELAQDESICLAGDKSLAPASPAQLTSLNTLVRGLQRRFAIGAEYVYLHADLTGSHCPGDMFNASEFRSILLPVSQ